MKKFLTLALSALLTMGLLTACGGKTTDKTVDLTAFYNTLAIPARENPRCRMTHMPKRFWEFLTELTPPSAKKEEKALTFFNEMVQ